MKNEMTTAYNANAAAHSYWFGFILAGLLYVVAGMDFDALSAYFKNDRASSAKGGFRKVRIRATSAELKALLPKALLLGSADLLMDDHWNKGEMFEKIITERFTGEKWVKDSVPFFVDGDATINGVKVQIKLNGAELTNEKILTRFGFLG
jgi:hypothetical protein